jgi:hypothetical protein
LPEIVSLFDRRTEDGTFVSLCFTRLSATVCEFFSVLWFSRFRPVVSGVHQRDPEKARPCVKPRRLSHHACLCDAPFGRCTIARKKIKNKIKNIKRKMSESRYISRMRGGALIQPIAMEVCTSV